MGIEAKHAYRFEYLKSEKWSTVRIEALAREKGKCQICGEESIHNDAHHVWYPESIWDTTETHLVVLCRCCHEFLHVMLPECKTGDEESGKAQWTRFRNAIIVWRLNKQGIFEVMPEVLGYSGPKDLRKGYDALKERFKEQQLVLNHYKKSVGEINIPSASTESIRLLRESKPTQSRTIKMEKELHDLLWQIYKWARKQSPSWWRDGDFSVDSQDFQI